MKLPTTLLFAVLAAFSATAFAGHDNGRRGYSSQHQLANEYASTAVRQASKARNLGCSFHGSRWSMSYDQHYNWALRSSHHEARRETNHRENSLNSCVTRYEYGHSGQQPKRYGYSGRSRFGIHSYGNSGTHQRDDFARWYADTATEQARQNHRYGCREKGNAWTTDWYDHFRWAQTARRENALRDVEERDYRLSRCRG